MNSRLSKSVMVDRVMVDCMAYALIIMSLTTTFTALA